MSITLTKEDVQREWDEIVAETRKLSDRIAAYDTMCVYLRAVGYDHWIVPIRGKWSPQPLKGGRGVRSSYARLSGP